MPENNPTVAIIVINQNGLEHLPECFSSLSTTVPEDIRIEMIDNGSSDGSVEYVKANFPSVVIHKHAINQGFAGGYDLAIRECPCDWVVLLNNDTETCPGWLEPLLKTASDPSVGACGSRMLCHHNATLVDHAGGKLSVLGGGVDMFKGEDKGLAPTLPFETGFACGGCMLVKKAAYEACGGFDPSYTIYHEDVDLGWKLWLLGFRVLHVPTSEILHKGSASMGHFERPHRVFLAQKNRLSNLIQNATLRTLVKGMMLQGAFDLVRVVKFLVTGNIGGIWALIRANVAVLVSLPRLLKKRGALSSRLVRRRTDIEKRSDLFSGARASFSAYLKMR